jgi:hypothetical protein
MINVRSGSVPHGFELFVNKFNRAHPHGNSNIRTFGISKSSATHGFVLLVRLVVQIVRLVVQKICGICVLCGTKIINERLMPHYTEINV